MAFDPEAFVKATSGKAFDPEAFAAGAEVPGDQQRSELGGDAGPAARRAASGLPPGPREQSDEDLGISRGMERGSADPNRRGRTDEERDAIRRAESPEASDPIAQGVIGGVLGAGAGALAAGGAAALGAPAVVANTVGGAAGGATSAAAQGGDPVTGAIVGGAIPAAAGAVSALWQKVGAAAGRTQAAANAAAREDERLFQGFGKAAAGAGKQKTLSKLEAIGPEQVADVVRRHEIGSVNNGIEARAATQAALAKTGQQIGTALDAIDAVPGRVTVGDAMDALEAVRAAVAKNPNKRPIADALHSYMKDFFGAMGGDKKAQITAKQLHALISELESSGYSGASAQLPAAAQKVVARQAARALNGVLDNHMAAAAKSNPATAEALKSLETATRDYKVLKTIQPIVNARAVAERFPVRAPAEASMAQNIATLAAPARALRHPLEAAANAAGAVSDAASLARDVAMARLFRAAQGGAVPPPEALQAAVEAGVPVATVDAFRRRLRAAPVAP